MFRIGPLSGDDALRDRREGTAGAGSLRSLSFECKSSRVEELADVRKALVYLYRLVNRATSCETGDRLDLRRISHWEPIWTTQTAEGLFSF